MAQVEPIDIDAIESDFDNKENAFHCNNVLSRTPCTEKGYEELDVSELNMKLRYSITPASSPMSKSFTGPCLDNKNCNSEDHSSNILGSDNVNLSRSLNSTMTKSEGLNKSKALPLQTLSMEPFLDSNRNPSLHRSADLADNNVIISVNNTHDIDENMSLPSTCSSAADTPEATTPTKDIPKPEGSPIMRGLKSVLSMFRPSQSPIPPADNTAKLDILSPVESTKSQAETVQVSTPVTANKLKDANTSKRSSPLKDSLVFNDDLERELLWKDETTIIFKEEKIPVHKLFFQNPIPEFPLVPKALNTTVEQMDISCDASITIDEVNKDNVPSNQTYTTENLVTGESDNEFLDCENTFTKNESQESEKLITDNVTGTNVIDNPTIVLENLKETNTEGEKVAPNTICVTPVEIPTCNNEAFESVSSISSNIEKTNVNIIEATIDLISNEINESRKLSGICDVGSENKPQVNTQLKDPEITPIDNEMVTKDGPLNHNESKPITVFNIENDNRTSKSLDSNEIKESQHLDNILHLGVETNIVHLKNRSEISNVTETKEEIAITDDMSTIANDIKVDKDLVASDSVTINNETIHGIESMADIDKCNKTDKLENIQCQEKKSNTDLLTSNNDNMSGKDSVSIPLDKNFINPIESMPVTQIIKSEDDMSIHSETFTEVNNKLNCEDISNNDYNLVKDNMIREINNETLSDNTNLTTSVKDLIISTDSPPVQSDLQEDLTFIANSIENVLENTHKPDSLQKKSEENTILNDKNMEFSCNTNTKVAEISDKSLKESALIIENEAVVSTSPSEIPLPDEDDIEQNISGTNGVHNEVPNTQVTTIFQECDAESNIDVKTESFVDDAKGTTSITLDSTKKTETAFTANYVNELDTELFNKTVSIHEDKNYTRSCDIQSNSILGTNVITVNTYPENVNHGKVILNLQTMDNNILLEDNSLKNVCISDGINNNIEGIAPEILLNENTESKTIEDISNSNKEISCIINAVVANIENSCDSNSIDKSKQVEMHIDNQRSFILEKEVDAADEEIITSTNNSPYVSVTELDIITENIGTVTVEKNNDPFNTNTNHTISPSSSPKIVSKGYNFNFDDIDDPFATKTKIRMSPTRDTLNQSSDSVTKEIKPLQEVPKKSNRRKSQPAKKSPVQKKVMNSTFNSKLTNKESSSGKCSDSFTNSPKADVFDNISMSDVENKISESKLENCAIPAAPYVGIYDKGDEGDNKFVTLSANQRSTYVLQEKTNNDEDMKSIRQTLVMSTDKSTSSSEQYFSLGTSSGEGSSVMNRSKNVFNLPEIDDVNFNPFATKSKMRMSPPLLEKPTTPLGDTNNVSKSSFVIEQSDNTTDKNIENNVIKQVSNDSSPNISNATCSSKTTNDIDTTVREILTEDEDTVEGPFLEVNDLTDIQKPSDVDMEPDMMNFEEIPQEEREENLENGELFIDADAFEFLLNQNKSSTVLDSGKESLFLKFDPLFAKRVSSDGILAALSKVQKRQSTPKKLAKSTQRDFSLLEKSSAGPSTNNNVICGNIEENNEDLSSTVTKPMMVVNPAVSSFITQKKTATPKLNRRSLTFTSPAMAVIDRLLSLSGNSSHLEHDASIPQIGREQSETDLAITQLRELLAEKEIHVHTLRSESKELKDRLASLEVQVRGLETESAERLSKINELNERLLEKTKINKSMAVVVEEYERTIASLIAETEHDKKRNAEERMKIIKERDEQTAHLTSMEVSFSDLHSKYEKSKQIILSCKANEDIYKKSIKEFQDNFAKMQNNYELLKQHATSKLNHANQELEKMNRAHEAEVLKLNAMIKRKELHITSLEETLVQKTKANEELTAICDELINKVG